MEIKLWKEQLMPYSLAVDELVIKFNHIKNAYEQEGNYSPIYSISGRVKSISSILDKVAKKKIPLDTMEEQITDLAGIRIICQFLDDCYKVAEIIKKRKDMEVVEENDYITNPKKSGYRSYHILVKYTVQLLDGPKEIYAEIQIRTMGMNCWSTIEHSLQYKYNGNMPEALKIKLLNAANNMLAAENDMSMVRDEVMNAQASKAEESNIISNIILTILNIYQNASRREAVRIQEEFLQIYQSGDFDKLKHFSDELDVIAEGYGQQSL